MADTIITKPARWQGLAAGAVVLLILSGAAVVLPFALGALPAALLGAAGLALSYFAWSGKRPTLAEAALDALVIAVIVAARNDALALWQLPGGWLDQFRLSEPGAIVVWAVYIVCSLTVQGRVERHLAWREGIAVLLVPILFDLLLSLSADYLMAQLAGWVTFGSVSSFHLLVAIGRSLVLLVFGEVMIDTLSVLITGHLMHGPRLRGLMLVAAVHAALTSGIADLAQAADVLGGLAQFVVAVAAASLAQAGLWAIVFMATGMALDALDGAPPSFRLVYTHWKNGFLKGAIYGGVFMLLLLLASAFLRTPMLVRIAGGSLPLTAAVAGALLFPLAQTIVASADGTAPFFGRLAASYRNPRSYLRGVVVGLGALLALASPLRDQDGLIRFLVTFAVGALAYGGVDLVDDIVGLVRGRRRVLETWRLYGLGILLGGLVGGALGWYFDAAQIAVVTAKFWSYVDLAYPAAGRPVSDFIIYPWFNKWGSVNLGPVGGGVRLFYNESLSGVINWSIAAPLFSINFFILAAIFQRSLSPIKKLFSADGFKSLVTQAVRVLRWGLWMAPVINSFLRQAPNPSWYNQDGAVRTAAATVGSLLLPADTFRNASLSVFTGLLAYDWLRVLIWFDHMGLRVATLVNLTFIGGDRADEAAARFVGYAARTRIIPEGIRRFATWAPLLIPFYIPHGADWDTAWTGAEKIRATSPPIAPAILGVLVFYAVAFLGGVLAAWMIAKRWGWRRASSAPGMPGAPQALVQGPQHFSLSNGLMGVEYGADGRGFTHIEGMSRGGGPIDLSRRPTDPLQLRGTFFYVRDAESAECWSIGYEPLRIAAPDYSVAQLQSNCLEVVNTVGGVRAEAFVSLAEETCVESWRIRLIEREGRPRRLSLTSFLELGVNEPGAYIRDTDFNAMHVETWFVRSLNAVLARNRLLHVPGPGREVVFHGAAAVGTGVIPSGYEDSRTRFIGDGDLRRPQGLDVGRARGLDDQGALYTFDPAASLSVAVDLPANGVCEIVFVTGHARNEVAAARMLAESLGLPVPGEAELRAVLATSRMLEPLPLPPPDVWPFRFSKAGTELHLTPRTPRPWAHVLANAAGYGAVVSNDGEIHSFAGNERQNALTPFRFESVTTSLPGQVIYVVDLDTEEAHTATFVPYRRADTRYDVTYTLGTAVFRSSREDLDLELTFFVVPASRADVRILTLHNKTSEPKRYRVVPYFDMVLAENPDESLGNLAVARDQATEALLFRNRANDFRKGWAFVTTSLTAVTSETVRARFIGAKGRDLSNPVMVETGAPDRSQDDDGRRIAAFSGVVKVPANDKLDVAIVLGQTGRRHEALITASHLRDPVSAHAALEGTRAWWAEHVRSVHVETNNPGFDRLVNYWLPYQLVTARLWGRTGPNQRGGAIGFRDQLQDVIPLLLFDPNLTRRQIVLHARQQFPEGDVLKWWHTAPDGRTGIGQRTHASDPHLWLPYVVIRYLASTGDTSVLDEDIPYLEAAAVPKGAVDLLVAPRASGERGSVYDHCVRAIEFALARTGAHGLPLIGTGDWNDSIDIAGIQGRGESVWLGFFLHSILHGFGGVAGSRGDDAMSIRCGQEADRLKAALESAWLGDGRYVLAFADSGEPIAPQSAMVAAWPILSGAVDFERGLAALDGALAHLEKPDRILLLTPPFDDSSHPYPGRVVDYPPGVRENGGQYSHGASWTVDAYVRLAQIAKERDDAALAARMMARAFTCWTKISPLGKTEGEHLAIYGLAPHQQAADIYDGPGYEGRGGWSWYTGAAARMLSAAYAILGLDMKDGETVVPEDLFEPKGELVVRELRIHGHTYTAPARQKVPERSA